MKTPFIFVIIASLLIIPAWAQVPAGFDHALLASGLEAPVQAINLPDGRTLVAEQGGKVRIIKAGVLLADPLLDISNHTNAGGDRGLLSIAADPDYDQNGYLYLAYTYGLTDDSAPKTNRLTRVTIWPPWSDTINQTIDPPETVLIGSINSPLGYSGACVAGSDCMPSDSNTHVVGQLLFAPDKTLFLSIGDGAGAVGVDTGALRAQDIDWLSGKVLHVDRNGSGLSSNPFYNGNASAPRSKVYWRGVRNTYRLVWHPQFGLYGFDVGWNTWEEINHASPGSNMGWPCYEGQGQNTLYASLSACQALYAQGNVTPPMYSYAHNSTGASILGGAVYMGNTYPSSMQGNLFFGDYARNQIMRANLTAQGAISAVTPFFTSAFGIVDIFADQQGDIGWLSVWTGEARVFRYTVGNHPPVPSMVLNATSGPLPLKIRFDASATSDPDGNPLTYTWDFGDGTHGSGQLTTHTYTTAGTRTVTLRASDGQLNASLSQIVYAGDTAPQVSIIAPANNSVFQEGTIMNFRGTATDAEDGVLGASQLRWRLLLHHNDHLHGVFDNLNALNGSFQTYYHGNDSYFQLQLFAKDSQNLTVMKSVDFKVVSAAAQGQCAFATGANASNAQLAFPASALIGAPDADGECSSAQVGRSWAPTSWNVAATLNLTIPQMDVANLTIFGDQGMSWQAVFLQNDSNGRLVQIGGLSTACNATFAAPAAMLSSRIIIQKTAWDWSATDAIRACSATIAQQTCGNGVIEAPESCDDGNLQSNDGCSATCQTESACGDGICSAFESWASCPADCSPVCGNGQREGAEQCDDGNTQSNDGCSATCQTEQSATASCFYAVYANATSSNAGSEAQYATGAPDADLSCAVWSGPQRSWNAQNWNVPANLTVVFPGTVQLKNFTIFADYDVCYSRVWARNTLTGQEQLVSTGAINSCQSSSSPSVLFPVNAMRIEKCAWSWSSTDAVQVCGAAASACGDGVCNANETWTSCPADCSPVCGNGQREGAEQCDDGNTQSNDGCSATCQTESACGNGICNANETWTSCPADCSPVCGNGQREGAEQCDDGNTQSNDGCSATCQTESVQTCVFAIAASATSSNTGSEAQYATGAPDADLSCAVWSGPQRSWNAQNWNVLANITLTYAAPLDVSNLTIFGEYDICWSGAWLRDSQTGAQKQVFTGASSACQMSVQNNGAFRADQVIVQNCGYAWSSTDAVQLCGSAP